MLFVLVNIARYLSLDPESALKKITFTIRRKAAYVTPVTSPAYSELATIRRHGPPARADRAFA